MSPRNLTKTPDTPVAPHSLTQSSLLQRVSDESGSLMINVINYFLGLLIQISCLDVIINPYHYMVFEGAFNKLMEDVQC